MDIEGGEPIEMEAAKSQEPDSFKQLQGPQKAIDEPHSSSSDGLEVVQVVADLTLNVAAAAIDIATYEPLLDSSVEVGGAVLEGLGEVISAIAEGL